jgi:hypothetical protein
VERGGKCYCSPHAWGDPRFYERITQQILDELADKAMQAQRYEPPRRPPTEDERKAVRDGLRAWIARSRDQSPQVKHAWAHDLLARIKAGEVQPTQAQRDALKAVIPGAFDADESAWGEAA